MTSIEDQTNQLFSSILIDSRGFKNAKYDGESFTLGTGPLRKNGPETGLIAVLNENENILGLGHPLTIKGLLIAALQGGGHADSDEVLKLTKSFEKFLSMYLENISLSLSLSLGAIRGKRVNDLGRSTSFFSDETKNLLLSGETIYSLNFLTIPLTLEIKKNKPTYNSQSLLSKSDLRQTQNLLKLIQLGQIYGSKGVISNKQKLLKNFFEKLDPDVLIDGLVVKTSKALNNEYIIGSESNILYFPFLFDEESLETIGDLLEK